MWSFAYKTLLADRGKFLTALGGVVFAYVLANVQGGLYFGLLNKASLLIDHTDAQIWVGHYGMENPEVTQGIPLNWIDRVRAVPGVKRAEPYSIALGFMTLPSGGFEEVIVVGVEPNNLLGNAWNVVEGSPEAVRQPDGIIVDYVDDSDLEYPRVGDVREIGGRRARIVAKSDGITGFLVSPYVFTTVDRAARYTGKDPNFCSYYLVQTNPGVDPKSVCEAIVANVPEVDAQTVEEYAVTSRNFWMTRTGIGISFGAATALGLIIGLVMVANTLYTLVLDRLLEFATLKAIGSPAYKVYSVLFLQAAIVGLLGSIVGFGIVSVIKRAASTPIAPIVIPSWLYLATAVLVLSICLVSALLPYLQVRRVDPVMVLQS